MLNARFTFAIQPPAPPFTDAAPDPRLTWIANGPGTGRYTFIDERAAVFIGFNTGQLPIKFGPITLQSLDTAFATFILLPANPNEKLTEAKQLLLAAVGRAENTNARRSEDRRTVINWGTAPPRIETIKAKLQLPPDATIQPAFGTPGTIWYQITRQP
jgi:hypothetical protein